MKFRFKPEMFKWDHTQPYLFKNQNDWAASEANRILDEHLKTLIVVYGSRAGEDWSLETYLDADYDTHAAFLFDLEPIEAPKPCEHVLLMPHYAGYSMDEVTIPMDTSYRRFAYFTCKKCGKKLRPKFEICE